MNGLISIVWILKTERYSKADFLYYATMGHIKSKVDDSLKDL
jgi:hypothetical protein